MTRILDRLGDLRALSVRQPWDWSILYLRKDIENRNWSPNNPGRRFRGEFLLHAGKKPDWRFTREDLADLYELSTSPRIRIDEIPDPSAFPGGALIGKARITGVITESASPWFMGPLGLVVDNPVAFSKPIPCNGQLGFFRPQLAPEAAELLAAELAMIDARASAPELHP